VSAADIHQVGERVTNLLTLESRLLDLDVELLKGFEQYLTFIVVHAIHKIVSLILCKASQSLAVIDHARVTHFVINTMMPRVPVIL
jgi:hypothetical protein